MEQHTKTFILDNGGLHFEFLNSYNVLLLPNSLKFTKTKNDESFFLSADCSFKCDNNNNLITEVIIKFKHECGGYIELFYVPDMNYKEMFDLIIRSINLFELPEKI